MAKFVSNIASVSVALLCATGAQASPIVLDFEGAGDIANLNNFYNGGTDSLGNSGTNHGIAFGSNSLTVIDIDAGGSGNIANEPTPNTILFFLTGSAVLNYAPGFDTGFSFFYSSATTATVLVYDGLDATGNVLASINLAAQYNNGCTGDPNGSYCNWTAGGAAFSGTAKSIDFGGTVNRIGYDNITFGSATPLTGTIPEPTSLLLAGLALCGLAASRRRPASSQQAGRSIS